MTKKCSKATIEDANKFAIGGDIIVSPPLRSPHPHRPAAGNACKIKKVWRQSAANAINFYRQGLYSAKKRMKSFAEKSERHNLTSC